MNERSRVRPLLVLVAIGAVAACGGSGPSSGGTSSSSGGGGSGGGASTSSSGTSNSTGTSSTSSTTSSSTTSSSTTSSSTTSSSTTSSSSSSSGTGGGCAAPAPATSDTFGGAALDASWSVLNPGFVDLSVSGGKLSLKPNQYLLWYNQNQGTLVSKPVTGDFKVTSIVRSRRASNPSLPPDDPIHLAGLMARKPGGSPENYVFIVVGNDENDLSVETKSTVNGVSDYVGPSWPSGDAELRICRLGASMRLYERALGATTWTLAATYARPDLPATLEVGVNVYAAGSPPDLVATFDEVRFEGVCDLAGCTDG